MIITTPPHATDAMPPNLRKQYTVFTLCTDVLEDDVLTPLDSDTTLNLLYAVHQREHMDAVLGLTTPNGFGNRDPLYLHHAVTSCGALLAAVRAVTRPGWYLTPPSVPRRYPPRVAFAPVSGFHHAGWDYTAGYCTFNGLAAAAAMFLEVNPDSTVCILDGDGHYGDGTADILSRYPLLRERVDHVSLDYSTVRGLPAVALAAVITALRKKPGLVLYQAGADAHNEDPYKSGYLTDADWDARDRLVFSMCLEANLPLVWCLAGGYNGTKTLTLHNRTFGTALRVYSPESLRHGVLQDPATSTAGTSSPPLSSPA